MSSTAAEKHRSAVANYLAGKVRELAYYLHVVVDACDKSLAFVEGREKVRPDDRVVVYGFSAFSNTIQALKDALKTIGGRSPSWSEIGSLRHGDFVGKARNAITHDGNPIVNAWADGKYFVATDISRLDMRNEPIEITRPEEDIRTICLEFALDYSVLLRERLEPMLGQFRITGPNLDKAELDKAIGENAVIPDEVKQLYEANRDEIHKTIDSAPPFDPLVKAIAELRELEGYCRETLETG